MSARWSAGTVIHGRYRLDSILGRGGMGSVWRAEHLQLRSPVAIKLLDDGISHNPQMLARFTREAQAAALLRSPHVVQILDVGVGEGTAFIAMELLRGESLAERIVRLERLPAEEAIVFLSQVLRAIGKAHEAGIVHRDLKPANIFICAEEPEFAKVLDFGVAKVTAGELSAAGGAGTQPGVMIGTPYYMSPEQMRARDVDARADLWSIAVIAYECMIGVRPFAGDELGELVLAICTGAAPIPSQNGRVPPGFDQWFAKGTQRDREQRFGSAREMAEELIKLSAEVGPSRPQFATVRNIAAIPITVPRPEASTSHSAGDRLDLTTGQRAATSQSLHQGRAPLPPAVRLSLAAAALVAAGLGALLASGRAPSLKTVPLSVTHSGSASTKAAASLATTVPSLAAESQPAPAQPAPAARPAVSGAAPSSASARRPEPAPAPTTAHQRMAAPPGSGSAKVQDTLSPPVDLPEFGRRR
jgi:serine/threonine protein kinase